MDRMAAFIAAASVPVSFALGAWVQDIRVHQTYIGRGVQQGRSALAEDAFNASALAYLTCLKEPPGCDKQRATYEWIVQRYKKDIGL